MTSDTAPMIIIGAGHAGGRAALTLRAEGYTGPLILIGDEPHLPYERPPLSKGLLQGQVTLGDFSLCQAAHLTELGIQHLSGQRVVRLAPAQHRLHLADGRVLDYQRLLLATGGQVRRLAQVPTHFANVLYLRTHEDAERLREQLLPGARVVIVGGGFIGLEVAASARQAGCTVTLLEAGPRLAGRVVSPRLSAALLYLHREHGVEVHLDTGLQDVSGQQQVEWVQLADGTWLPCDVLVVGIGIQPAVELAREAGLDVGQGIRVDECLRASAPDMFVAGDACEFRLHPAGDFQRQETWRNAEDQGRHAALNMLGANQPFRGVPYFWSDQYDWSLQSVGSPHAGTPSAQRDLPDGGFLQFYLDAEQCLQGASGWASGNAIARDIKLCERLIDARVPLDRKALADSGASLKHLLRTAHA